MPATFSTRTTTGPAASRAAHGAIRAPSGLLRAATFDETGGIRNRKPEIGNRRNHAPCRRVSGFRFPNSGLRFVVSDFRFLVSGFERSPVSEIRFLLRFLHHPCQPIELGGELA